MVLDKAMHDDITAIPGLRVGHETDVLAATGCTVLLCDTPAVGGVDVRGGAPATRETDLLRPMTLVDRVDAILLSGGSAFGLDAASGVMRYLAERNIGYDTGVVRVPIVPAAAIFDLTIGSATTRPDALSGYRACQNASTGPVPQGNVGAGTGATVGKLFGPALAMKGGLGSASTELLLPSSLDTFERSAQSGSVQQSGAEDTQATETESETVRVAALVVVNALGDILDPQTQRIVAGARSPLRGEQPAASPTNLFGNTTLAVVATTASLSKEEVNKVAQMAHDGLALVTRPAHTLFDGDTIFALALGTRTQAQLPPSTAAQRVSMIGAAAAATLARAVLKGIQHAQSLHGVPAAQA